MKTFVNRKPTSEEQFAARESYESLVSSIELLKTDLPEIEIAETGRKIRIPVSVLRLMVQILKEISQGNPVAVVPEATEITTQAASEVLAVQGHMSFACLRRVKFPTRK